MFFEIWKNEKYVFSNTVSGPWHCRQYANEISSGVRSAVWLCAVYLVKFIFECPRFLTTSDHLFLVVFVFPILDLSLDLREKTILNGQMNVGNVLGLVKSAFQCVLVGTVLWTWQQCQHQNTFISRSYCTQYFVMIGYWHHNVVCLSVCNAVHCDARGRCRGLKAVMSCS